jgi:hypothetical protein
VVLQADSRPDELTRDAIADAVHAAVCGYTGTDGMRHCLLYGFGGSLALRLATGRQYMPQAGSLHLLIDPPDGQFEIDASDGGFSRGEFHCWSVLADRTSIDPVTRQCRALEWIDFSARHWRRMAETMQLIDAVVAETDAIVVCRATTGERIPWTVPAPPRYLWHAGATPPDGVMLVADAAVCMAFMRHLETHRAEFGRFARRVRDELTTRLPGRLAWNP